MKKSEIFQTIIGKVCEICEVDQDDVINGCKLQSVVDARMLVVQYLRRVGLSNDEIAEMVLKRINEDKPEKSEIKRKAKGVDKMFNGYSKRCMESYAFCLMSKDIKDFCHETYREHYLVWMKELPD